MVIDVVNIYMYIAIVVVVVIVMVVVIGIVIIVTGRPNGRHRYLRHHATILGHQRNVWKEKQAR